jgi:hypothetical protein
MVAARAPSLELSLSPEKAGSTLLVVDHEDTLVGEKRNDLNGPRRPSVLSNDTEESPS